MLQCHGVFLQKIYLHFIKLILHLYVFDGYDNLANFWDCVNKPVYGNPWPETLEAKAEMFEN